MSRRIAPVALAALLLLLVVPPAPVSAHCAGGGQTVPPVPFSTCPYNQHLETLAAQVSAASGGTIAVVFEKDQGFHPTVVTVKSGGTVLFVWADVDMQEAHQPQSSGLCANGANPVTAPEACVPSAVGKCFNIVTDNGGNAQDSLDDVMPLTWKYEGSTGVLQKSRGVLSDTPGLSLIAAPFKACPVGTAYTSSGQAVVPYHCQIHGAASSAVKTMRGTIVVLDG